jgi:hypothetical protein
MQQRLATTETISHLEHMRWEGKLRRIIKDNHIFYGLSGIASGGPY